MEVLRTLIGPDNGDASAAQLCARAGILFVFGIAGIRIAGRRTFSQAAPLDIIVALVIGGHLSRARPAPSDRLIRRKSAPPFFRLGFAPTLFGPPQGR